MVTCPGEGIACTTCGRGAGRPEVVLQDGIRHGRSFERVEHQEDLPRHYKHFIDRAGGGGEERGPIRNRGRRSRRLHASGTGKAPKTTSVGPHSGKADPFREQVSAALAA